MVTKKTIKNNISVLLALLVFAPLSVQAVSIEDELKTMLKGHPKLKSAQSFGQSAAWDIERATDNYFPVFSINGESGPDKYTSDTTTFGQERKLDHTKVTYELRQNLFRGFRDEAAVSASRAEKKIADFLEDKITQDLILQGVSVYIDGLRVKQLDEIIDKKVGVANQLLGIRKRAKDSGAGTDVDVLEASLAMQKAYDERLVSEAERRAVEIRYAQLFNGNSLPEVMESVSLPAALQHKTVEQALQVALKNNPELAVARMRMEVARNEKKNSAGDYYPTLDLVGRRDYDRNLEGSEGKSLQKSVLLEMSWSFNLANQTGAAVSSAAEKISAAQFEYDSILKDVEQSVRLAHERYKNLSDRKALANQTLEIASNVLDSRIAQRKAGKVDQTLVIGAQARLLSAKHAAITTRFETLKSGFELAFATGVLTPAKLGISIK